MKNNRYIAFFDSGIGGLTTLKECIKILPNEKYIYYGDNKNAPYGNKSHNEVRLLVEKAFKYFNKKKVKAVVIACNTVTAEFVDELRKIYNYKILGIEPAINLAKKNGGTVVVLCTKMTAESKKFNLLIKDKNITVLQCQKLAGLIEKNIYNLDKISLIDFNLFKEYDNIVLGCTHYIFMKKIFAEECKKSKIIDGNEGVSKNLKRYLKDNQLLNNKFKIASKKLKIKFCGSGKKINKKIFYVYV